MDLIGASSQDDFSFFLCSAEAGELCHVTARKNLARGFGGVEVLNFGPRGWDKRRLSPPGLLDLGAGWILPAALARGLPDGRPVYPAQDCQHILSLRATQFHWGLFKTHSVQARAADIPQVSLTATLSCSPYLINEKARLREDW